MLKQPESGPDVVVALNGVTKSYWEVDRRRSVLEAVDLEIRAGERVALVGRSGSGKSTLLNLIGGIDEPAVGEVSVLGQSLGRLGEPRRTLFRRQHIGFVYQFFNLIPTLSVAENVALPLELNGLGALEIRQRVGELLRRVGLHGRERSFPDRLSGGEQQRVAISRALVHRPTLLLADEPTGSLDEETGEEVLQLLDELLSATATTMLLVTHSHEVAAICDRVLRLEHGSLVPTQFERVP